MALSDPSIFDNLRVVLEGAVYDLDLEGEALVTSRSDRVDLAAMARHYTIRFVRRTEGDGRRETGPQAAFRTEAAIHLASGLADLAGEKLEADFGRRPGCEIWIEFSSDLSALANLLAVSERWGALLDRLWGEGTAVRHKACEEWDHPGGRPARRRLTSSVLFRRTIDERQIDDLPELVGHVLRTLEELEGLPGN